MRRAQEALAGRGMVRPATTTELADAIRSAQWVVLEGAGTQRAWRAPFETATLSTSQLRGIVELEPNDQVVVARAGTTLSELNQELIARGQSLPFGGQTPTPGSTLGGLIANNLPHTLSAQCGSWRDWVLGMTVVLADGRVAKCGSKAVKNVAGYDVQRFMVGSRGTLAIIAEVILRTWPVASIPDERIERFEGYEVVAIQRTLATDFDEVRRSRNVVLADDASCTAWLGKGTHDRFEHDWLRRIGVGLEGQYTDVRAATLQAKSKFDPMNKLNPQETAELCARERLR